MNCEIRDCNEEAIGEQTNQDFWLSYVTYKVCEKHAWPCLRNAKTGESGHGINVSWKKY